MLVEAAELHRPDAWQGLSGRQARSTDQEARHGPGRGAVASWMLVSAYWMLKRDEACATSEPLAQPTQRQSPHP